MSALELAQSLIKIKSISPKDGGCFELIEAELSPLGFQIERIPELNCETLLAKYGDSGKVFCYLGHTDVVPSGPEEEWTSHPFEANVIDGELIGRGAADMKGSVAAFVQSVKNFLSDNSTPNFQIWIMLTSNEEGEPADGKINTLMDSLTKQNQFIDYCLVGEASSSAKLADTIRLGRRGSLSGILKINGKQGHVAYPEKVKNPIHIAGTLIDILKETEWDKGNEFFQPTSFQISNISSGTGATNVVPGELEMKFNIRFSSESSEDSLKEKILEILDKNNINYDIEWALNAIPFITKKTFFKDVIIKSINDIVGYEPQINNGGGTSDGRWIAPMGTEVVELGPINETIHQINEKVSVDDLENLKKIYKQILTNLNQKQ